MTAPTVVAQAGHQAAPAGVFIVVHTLDHAVAVLTAAAEAGLAITLLSAPDAGIYAGPGWFRALIKAARDAVPAVPAIGALDCGDDAGAAQAAIRAGIDIVIFTGRADVANRLADIAGQHGVELKAQRPCAVLDLTSEFFAGPEALRRYCADSLARTVRFC
jgi:hypothetical protein